jgi:hypothetical protein
MAANKLSKFMGDLAKDRAKMDAFKADPHDEMTKAGIAEKDQLAILSKRPDLINKALGHGVGAAAADAETTVVVIVL